MKWEEGTDHLNARRLARTGQSFLFFCLLAACGSRSSEGEQTPPEVVPDVELGTAPPLTTASSVEALLPTDGSFEVEPSSSIVLLVLPPDADLSAEELFVRDRGSRLAGTWNGDAATGIWSWTAANELPRGNKIEVGTAVRGVLSTFTVREGAMRSVSPPFWTFPLHAFAWSSGRRALMSPQGVFELQGQFMSMRSALALRGARAAGEQALASVGGQFPQGECLRTLLDGSTLRASAPVGSSIADVDERGDVLLFAPRSTMLTGNEGFLRWRRDSVSPEHVAPSLFSAGTVVACMHDDGSTSVARKEATTADLTWFALGSPVGRKFAFDPDALTFDYDADARGDGWLIWTTREVDGGVFVYRLRWARTSRSELTTLPNSYLIGPAPFHPPAIDLHLAQSGRATIDLRARFEDRWQHRLLEFDSDGDVEDHGVYYSRPLAPSSVLPPVSTYTTPRRGEFWAVIQSPDRKSLLLRRSKPGRGLDAPRIVYNMLSTAPSALLWSQSLAVDDSGRAILAITGNYERAVVVIE